MGELDVLRRMLDNRFLTAVLIRCFAERFTRNFIKGYLGRCIREGKSFTIEIIRRRRVLF